MDQPPGTGSGVVLDLSAVIALFRVPGQAGALASGTRHEFWIPLGFLRFLKTSPTHDLELVSSEFAPELPTVNLRAIPKEVEEVRAIGVYSVARRKLEMYLGEGAFRRMRSLVVEQWPRMGRRASSNLTMGLLHELLAKIIGPGPSGKPPAVVLSVGREHDGKNRILRVLRAFGQKVLEKSDPVFEKIGPAAEAWEKKKLGYTKKLLHPTREKLGFDGFSIFVTVAVVILTANPAGTGTFLILRLGDFVINGGGTRPGPG
jgi:hypothetical protein